MFYKVLMLFGVLSVVLAGAGLAPAAYYVAVDLGVPPGLRATPSTALFPYTMTKGMSINSSGDIAVTAYLQQSGNDYPHAFSWSGGTWTNLETGVPEHEYSNSFVGGINDSGHVGYAGKRPFDFMGTTLYVERALYWNGTAMVNLGHMDGPIFGVAYGTDINNGNKVVGYSTIDTNSAEHAFINNLAGFTDLGTLSGGDNSYAYGVNDSDNVVGVADNGTGQDRAFLHNGTVMSDLGTLGGFNSRGYDISNAGIVVGEAQDVGGIFRAFKWDSVGGMASLSAIFPNDSAALGVNENGEVVGYGKDAGGNKNAFYSDGTTTVDLNSRIDPALAWDMQEAADINDSGYITGSMPVGGNAHAYLLKPALLGDANLDGTVDVADLGDLLTFYNQTVTLDVNGWMKGDFDGSGLVDQANLGNLLTFYNQSLGMSVGGSVLDAAGMELLAAHGITVPEPSSLVLLATLLASGMGLAIVRRRRGRRTAFFTFHQRDHLMKHFILILSDTIVLIGAASSQAEYIATVAGTRTVYDESLDKLTFTIDTITPNSKVITMEGTWMALGTGATLYMDNQSYPDWIYETNRTVRNDDPLSYVNFQYSNDALGVTWARTGDGTYNSELLTGSWYTSNESYKVELGETLAVMYVPTGAGASFSGKMTVSEYAVGSTTSDYNFSVALVPEPSTLALLASGLIGLLCYAWRKRR